MLGLELPADTRGSAQGGAKQSASAAAAGDEPPGVRDGVVYWRRPKGAQAGDTRAAFVGVGDAVPL